MTYPGGAVASTGTVIRTQAVDGRLGVVLDRTAFHAVDAHWPDQPADRGTLTVDGTAYEVLDAIVGASEGDSLYVGEDIPVRTGTDGWSFVVVHLVHAGASVGIGDEASIAVDEAYRAALSAGHTACHLASLALDAALAHAWTKDVSTDALGAPGFDALAIATSRILENGSRDVYRIGKSLRRKGFEPAALDDPAAVAEHANGLLAGWVASAASVEIERDGDLLAQRRRWVCDLPGGPAVIPCGGTHVHDLGELAAAGGVRVSLATEQVEGALQLEMLTRVG